MINLKKQPALENLLYEKMGVDYFKDYSIFKVFSPLTEKLSIRIFDHADSITGNQYEMAKDENGIFEILIEGDLKDKFYTYIIDENLEVTDPYSIGVSINSGKSAIIDMEETNPEGWEDQIRPKIRKSEAIIYEMHVKDFTFSKNSNVKNRGKYLGLTEFGTKYEGISTGIDHLKELGVNAIHLMPVYDFITVNEEVDMFYNTLNYNWGYDPELFNVPEGSYATDPTEPKNRIREFKEMIMALHNQGMKVIIDVVYNHVYRGENSNFESLAPGYYLRRNKMGIPTNGAGVGTEMDTEKTMYRKFILDSIKWWIEEYKIDGFRFDLMGLIDLETMKEVTRLAKSLDKDIIIYGEPWTGGYTPLKFERKTVKGTQKGKGFSCFNDVFRDCIKGDNNGTGKGFVMGDFNKKLCVETGVAGSINFDSLHIGFTREPEESINYVNSHDDLILADKINLAMGNTNYDDRVDMNKLALGIIFTSFGIPFIHEGNEFLRSKNFRSNTYNGPADLNAIDWSLKLKNLDYFNYIRELIEMRKEIQVFSDYNKEKIRNNLFFLDLLNKPIIGYIIKKSDCYYIFFHNSSYKKYNIDFKIIKNTLESRNHIKLEERDLSLLKIFDKNGKIEIGKRVELDELIVDSISTEIYKLEIKK